VGGVYLAGLLPEMRGGSSRAPALRCTCTSCAMVKALTVFEALMIAITFGLLIVAIMSDKNIKK